MQLDEFNQALNMENIYIQMTVNETTTYAVYQGMDEETVVSLASELGTNVTIIDKVTYDLKNQQLNVLREQNATN